MSNSNVEPLFLSVNSDCIIAKIERCPSIHRNSFSNERKSCFGVFGVWIAAKLFEQSSVKTSTYTYRALSFAKIELIERDEAYVDGKSIVVESESSPFCVDTYWLLLCEFLCIVQLNKKANSLVTADFGFKYE